MNAEVLTLLYCTGVAAFASCALCSDLCFLFSDERLGAGLVVSAPMWNFAAPYVRCWQWV